jgi:hypothetical protein
MSSRARSTDELFRFEVDALPSTTSLIRTRLRARLAASPELERASFAAQSAVSEVVMLMIETTEARRIILRGNRLGDDLQITVTGLVESVRGTAANHELAFRLLCGLTHDVQVNVARASEGVIETTLLFALE